MADGIYWFTDPGRVAQKFSVGAKQLGDESIEAVERVAQRAADDMRGRVETGGVKDKAWTGGPRARTWDMYDSIDAKAKSNSRARAQAEFGYINKAPGYTEYQEGGTYGGDGILPLNAMAMAMVGVEDELAKEAGEALERVWNNIWSR